MAVQADRLLGKLDDLERASSATSAVPSSG